MSYDDDVGTDSLKLSSSWAAALAMDPAETSASFTHDLNKSVPVIFGYFYGAPSLLKASIDLPK